MSGHTPSSGPGQHDAQPSAQSRGSQQGARPNLSLTQGSSQASCGMLSLYSPQQQSPILAAEAFWRAEIRQWFPDLHSQTYFVPPVHFNRVSCDVLTVSGQSVLVPQAASNQPHQQPAYFPASGPPPHPSDPPLASRVWPPYQPVPPGPLPVVYDADVKDDRAVQLVRDFIQRLAKKLGNKERVMVVISQLQFRKYLDNRVDPITAAAVRLLPRPASLGPKLQRGDFDMLMINGSYSLIVIEVKSVGANLTPPLDEAETQALTQAVTRKVGTAIRQLDKAETVLQHLTSDLGPVRITKTLALPFIQSKQLEGILATDQQLRQDLCRCLGMPGTDAAAAVSRCLLADDIMVLTGADTSDPTSSVWWQRTVTDHGPDANMTPELYERLAARFCGPATTIEVPTLTAPRHTVPLRTPSEGVALTGLTMSMLTLYPEQVNLVSRPDPRVFLWGPPGTGKTVILVLKAIQWGHQGKDIHLISTHRHSRAATMLIEHQLLHTPGIEFTATPPSGTLVSTTPPSGTLARQPRPGVSRRPTSARRRSLRTGSTPSPTPATKSTAPSATASTSAADPTAGPRVYTHFYDFENKGDVKAAVEELASVARDGKLFVMADEAFHDRGNTRGRFAEFCNHLARRVPALHLWAANVQRDVTPGCMVEERLTRPVRCPPAVVDHVARSTWIDDSHVPRYSSNSAIPAATDGPAVRQLPRHWQWSSRYGHRLSPGHTGKLDKPENCEQCADNITNLLTRELRVGQSGELRWSDVIILCEDPREDLALVRCLRARGVPVQVVRPDADEAVVRDVALAVRDAVTVTNWDVVSGLERRVVVVMGRTENVGNYADRLVGMSRCTALLAWVGAP